MLFSGGDQKQVRLQHNSRDGTVSRLIRWPKVASRFDSLAWRRGKAQWWLFSGFGPIIEKVAQWWLFSGGL